MTPREPQFLQSLADYIETQINQTNQINWKVLVNNADGALNTIRKNVIEEHGIGDACTEILVRCEGYADYFRDRGIRG